MDETGAKMSQALTICRADGYPPETVRRARAMLVFLLDQADLSSDGEYQFEIIGSSEALKGVKKPYIGLAGDKDPQAIRATIRSRGDRDGTLSGLLRLPEGMDRKGALEALFQTAESFNQHDGWYEAFDSALPEPPPERHAAGASAQPELTSQTGLPSTESNMPNEDTNPSVSKPAERDELLAAMLKQVLAGGSSEGIFRGSVLAEQARKCFPDARPRWHSTGAMMELWGHRWIARVGHGEYQVRQSFIDAYQLRLRITEREDLGLGHGAKKDGAQVRWPRTKGNGTTAPQSALSSLEALLDQQVAIERQIANLVRAGEQELVQAVEVARSAVVTAQGALRSAEEVLARYREQHREQLEVPVSTPASAVVAVAQGVHH